MVLTERYLQEQADDIEADRRRHVECLVCWEQVDSEAEAERSAAADAEGVTL